MTIKSEQSRGRIRKIDFVRKAENKMLSIICLLASMKVDASEKFFLLTL